jgi:hypothetical protein
MELEVQEDPFPALRELLYDAGTDACEEWRPHLIVVDLIAEAVNEGERLSGGGEVESDDNLCHLGFF